MRLHPGATKPGRRKRHWVCLSSMALALFLLVPLIRGPVVYSPYRRRWRRYLSEATMRALETDKAAMVRYTPEPAAPMWVLSLPTATARRAAVNVTLAKAGVAFEFVDAVDGGDNLPEIEMGLLLGGPRLHYARKGDAFAQRKLAVDLSHFRLLFKLLGSPHDVAVVLEDDAQPAAAAGAATNSNFLRAVHDVLAHTPSDWDILYLTNQGATKVSPAPVAPGIRVFWDGAGTMAYVARRSFAVKVLEEAVRSKSWLNIDLLYTALVQSGEVAAYVADPPLAVRSAAAGGSSLGYEEKKGRGIIAEKLMDG